MDELSKAASAMGRKGGKAKAAKMTREQRSEAAKKAIAARWANVAKKKAEAVVSEEKP